MLDAIAAVLGRESPVLRIGFHRLDADEEPSLVTVDLETIGADVPEGLVWTDWATLPIDNARTGRAAVRPAALDRPARARTDADRPAVGRPGLVRPGHAVDARPDGRAWAGDPGTPGPRPGLGHLHGAAGAVDAGRCLSEVRVTGVPHRDGPDGAVGRGRPRPGDAGHRHRRRRGLAADARPRGSAARRLAPRSVGPRARGPRRTCSSAGRTGPGSSSRRAPWSARWTT